MAYYDRGWPEYVTVAERRARAKREVARLRKNNPSIAPVTIEGRAIAGTFWGKAWCGNLESYHDYETRLPRGRSYVRNNAVLDLRIAPLAVDALVSGSEIYTVKVKIARRRRRNGARSDATAPAASIPWSNCCAAASPRPSWSGSAGRARACFQAPPKSSSHAIADWASMCKHVAAVLYGVGARLDHEPRLLFRLRGVNADDLIADLDATAPLSKAGPAAGKVLETDDLSALFGLEMAPDEVPPTAAEPPARKRGKAGPRRAKKPLPTARRRNHPPD